MPSLHFKGKVFVQNHHLAVPFHELVPVKAKLPSVSGKNKLVFAPTKYLDQEFLDRYRITFCQLRFQICKAVDGVAAKASEERGMSK